MELSSEKNIQHRIVQAWDQMEQSKRAQCDAKSISTISVQCCFALEQKKSFMAEKRGSGQPVCLIT